MHIGILGAGFVGQSMARALVAIGYDVTLSSREPDGERMQHVVADLGTRARAATVADAVAGVDIVFLALRWDAIPDAVAQVDTWQHKTLIDAANRLGSPGSSSAELQQMTGANVVKAFNTIGAEHYQDPMFAGMPASMPLCGDAPEARDVVAALISELGFVPVDVGGLEHAHLLDALAELWIMRMRQTGERDFALSFLPKHPGTG
jgi:8-hydroxy-5-deazaflavin:NADPH oxidoreductase